MQTVTCARHICTEHRGRCHIHHQRRIGTIWKTVHIHIGIFAHKIAIAIVIDQVANLCGARIHRSARVVTIPADQGIAFCRTRRDGLAVLSKSISIVVSIQGDRIRRVRLIDLAIAVIIHIVAHFIGR